MDLIIDKQFVLDTDLDDLRDLRFKEDSEGKRYRERIIERIEEIGVEEWFKARGLPTDPNSVWVNRYCKGETTLGDEIYNDGRWSGFENQAYYLWENYLPIEMWTDKDLHKEYKEKPSLANWC